MLDLTSYRRKQKYAKPVTVMRELFHQYASSLKRKAYSTEELDPLARRTLSVQKFNQCLKQLQLQSNRTSSQVSHDKPVTQEKRFRTKYINTLSQRRLNKDDNNKKQPQCFKSLFSQTVNLFKAHPGIKMKCETNKNIQINNEQVRKQNTEKKSNLLFESKKIFVRNPTNLFSEMCNQKKQNQEKINSRKYKLRKMRRNWIINNLYHQNQNQEPTNKTKILFKVRMRQTYQQTKQNIFPC